MNPTRRSFLHQAALAALTTLLPPVTFAQKRFENQTEVMNDESLSIFDGVSPETFKQWIGSAFRMSRNGKQIGTVVLVSVKGIPSPEALSSARASRMVGTIPASSGGPSVASFSLRFKGRGNALPQDTYTLTHSWLGAFPLFLVPSGSGASPATYTATFNLLNPSRSNQ